MLSSSVSLALSDGLRSSQSQYHRSDETFVEAWIEEQWFISEISPLMILRIFFFLTGGGGVGSTPFSPTLSFPNSH